MNSFSKKALAGALAAGVVASAAGVWLWRKKKPPVPPKPVVAALHIPRVNRWRVSYYDAVLGEVVGSAFVDWDNGKAHLILRNPRTGAEKSLSSSNVKVEGENDQRLVMTLEGASPASEKINPPETKGLSEFGTSEDAQLNIKPAEPESSIPVKPKAHADGDKVRLELKADNFGWLTGAWSYHADPLTERNRDGLGRVGSYRLLSKKEIDEYNQDHDEPGQIVAQLDGGFVGLQSGRERWWPLPPEIADVVVMEDQLAYKDNRPIYRYPYAENRSPNVIWADETAYRTLFVIGRNLPLDGAKVYGVERPYSVVAVSTDQNLSEENKKKLDLGRQRLVAKLQNPDEQKEKEIREMEAVLIKVALEKDDLPGPKKFFWGHAKWLLQFGDNTAKARFVRPLKEVDPNVASSVSQVEATEVLYLPERTQVEVEVRGTVPFDQIPLRVCASSNRGAVVTLTARRVPGQNSLYRSDPMLIGAQGTAQSGQGGVTLAANAGDDLLAAVDSLALLDKNSFQFLNNPHTQAKLLRTPASSKLEDVGLWKEALLKAAKADGKETNDLSSLPGISVEEVSGVKVTVGDHAAMLLLRSEFVDLMQTQLDWLNNLKTDEDMEGFREWVKPFIQGDEDAYYAAPQSVGETQSAKGYVKYPWWLNAVSPASALLKDSQKDEILDTIDDANKLLGLIGKGLKQSANSLFNVRQAWGKNSAFGQLEVSGPRGSTGHTWHFYETFGDRDSSKTQFPRRSPYGSGFLDVPGSFDEAEWKRWHVQTARDALEKYRKIVQTSLDNAKNTQDGDLPELLKLTGAGFGVVVKRLVPRLMKLEEAGTPKSVRWVPDAAGRAAVLNLFTTAKAVIAQQDYSAIKHQYYLLAAQTVLIVPALVSEGALASIVSLAGNTLFWEVTSAIQIVETYKDRADVQLEFGYAAVLGNERLAEAQIKQSEWWQTFLSIGVQGALVGFQAKFDTLPKIEKEMAIFRGGRLMAQVEKEGVAAFRALPLERQTDVMAFLEDAATRVVRAPKEAAIVASLEEVEGVYAAKRISREVKEAKSTIGNAETAFPEEQKVGLTNETPPVEGTVPTNAAQESAITYGGLGTGFDISIEAPKINSPAKNSWWVSKSKSGETVSYKLGKRLGGGASSDVYEVLDAIGREKDFLKDGAVIKFVRSNEFGEAAEQINRMWHSNDLLKEAGTEFAAILEVHPEAEQPYLIQKLVDIDGKKIRMISVSSFSNPTGVPGLRMLQKYDKVSETFTPGMQRSVVKLYKQLAEKGMVSTDLSLPNLYFKNSGSDEWIAGILDVDHIIHVKRGPPSLTREWVKKIRKAACQKYAIMSVEADGRGLNTSFDFMEKMLEYEYGGNNLNSFIRFNSDTGQFEAALINPDIIAEYFPNFKKALR